MFQTKLRAHLSLVWTYSTFPLLNSTRGHETQSQIWILRDLQVADLHSIEIEDLLESRISGPPPPTHTHSRALTSYYDVTTLID